VKLTIFGGTGPTGVLLVRQALDEGHHVTAYTRNPAKLTITHPQLTIIEGELSDTAAIASAVLGADAVLSLLGPSSTRAPGSPITDGTKAIIAAMKEHGVRRLVASATFSVTDPHDIPPLSVRLMVAGVRRLAPRPYRDIIGTGQAVRASGLDWTLVRVGLLRDRPGTGKVTAGYLGNGVQRAISRANFADLVLRQASDHTWIGQAPAISDATS